MRPLSRVCSVAYVHAQYIYHYFNAEIAFPRALLNCHIFPGYPYRLPLVIVYIQNNIVIYYFIIFHVRKKNKMYVFVYSSAAIRQTRRVFIEINGRLCLTR